MSSLYFFSKMETHRVQRLAGNGASITLACGIGEYTALFDDAKRVSLVIGTRELHDLGDGIMESILSYKIPFTEMHSVLQKLSQRFSVALVDSIPDRDSIRFVCICRIDADKRTVDAIDKNTSPQQIIPSLDDF